MRYFNWLEIGASLAIVAIIGAGVWYIHHDGFKRGAAKVQAEWDKDKLAAWEAYNEALTAARDKEQTLANKVAELQRKRTDENARHVARERNLLNQLRNRPERTTEAGGVPTTPGTGTGCTGEGLARPDAEFLAGYAADAARLQSALNQCQASYESAKDTMKTPPT